MRTKEDVSSKAVIYIKTEKVRDEINEQRNSSNAQCSNVYDGRNGTLVDIHGK